MSACPTPREGAGPGPSRSRAEARRPPAAWPGECGACGAPLGPERRPQLLPCLHCLCRGCLSSPPADWEDVAVCPECPVCKQTYTLKEVTDNYLIRDTTSGSRGGPANKCGGCQDTNLSGWCVQCGEGLCGPCAQAHRRVRVTRDHTVLTESKGVRSAPTLFCPAHREEPLKLFCVSCDQVTCRDCQLTYHRHHRYQFVEEAVSSQRQHILSLLEHVRQQHERVKKMILELDLRLGEVEKTEKRLGVQTKALVVQLCKAVLKRKQDLMQEVKSLCDWQRWELSERQAALRRLGDRQEHALQFTETALTSDSSTALLHCKRQIQSELQRLLSQQLQGGGVVLDLRLQVDLEAMDACLTRYAKVGSKDVGAQSQGPGVASTGPEFNTPYPRPVTTLPRNSAACFSAARNLYPSPVPVLPETTTTTTTSPSTVPVLPVNTTFPSTVPVLPVNTTFPSIVPVLPETTTTTSPSTVPVLPVNTTSPSTVPVLPVNTTFPSTVPVLPVTTTSSSTVPVLSVNTKSSSTVPVLPVTTTSPSTVPVLSVNTNFPSTVPDLPVTTTTSPSTVPVIPVNTSFPSTAPVLPVTCSSSVSSVPLLPVTTTTSPSTGPVLPVTSTPSPSTVPVLSVTTTSPSTDPVLPETTTLSPSPVPVLPVITTSSPITVPILPVTTTSSPSTAPVLPVTTITFSSTVPLFPVTTITLSPSTGPVPPVTSSPSTSTVPVLPVTATSPPSAVPMLPGSTTCSPSTVPVLPESTSPSPSTVPVLPVTTTPSPGTVPDLPGSTSSSSSSSPSPVPDLPGSCSSSVSSVPLLPVTSPSTGPVLPVTGSSSSRHHKADLPSPDPQVFSRLVKYLRSQAVHLGNHHPTLPGSRADPPDPRPCGGGAAQLVPFCGRQAVSLPLGAVGTGPDLAVPSPGYPTSPRPSSVLVWKTPEWTGMASSPPVFMPVPQTILYKTVTPMLTMGTQQVFYIQQAAPQPQLLASRGTLGSCLPVFVQQLPANQLRALGSQRPIAAQLGERTPRLREVGEDVPSPRGGLQEVREVKEEEEEEEEEPVKENLNGRKEEEEEEEEEENLTGEKGKEPKDEEDLQENVPEEKGEEQPKEEEEERGTGRAGSPGGDALRSPVSRMPVPRVRLFRLPVEFPSDGPLPQFRIVTLPNDPRWILEQITEEPDTGTGSLVTKEVPGPGSSPPQLPSRSARRPPVGNHERCAVCGTPDRLVLCAECRTGFHRHCHVPPIPKTKRAQWQCMLCRDLSDVGDHYSGEFPGKHTCLAVPDQRKCEHLLLVLMCNTHSSALHRKPQVSPRSCHYIDVALIRGRLLRRLSPPYRTPAEFVSDIWLLLGNLMASSEDPRSVRELQGCFRRRLSEVFGNSLHPKLMRPPSYWEREEGEGEGEGEQQQGEEERGGGGAPGEEERGGGGARGEERGGGGAREEERGGGGAPEEEEDSRRDGAREEERGGGGAREEERGGGGAREEERGGGGAREEEEDSRRDGAQEEERGGGGAQEEEEESRRDGAREEERGGGGAREEERGGGGAPEEERGEGGAREEEEESRKGGAQEEEEEESRRGGAEEEESRRGGAQEERGRGGAQAEEGRGKKRRGGAQEKEGRGQKRGRGGAKEKEGRRQKRGRGRAQEEEGQERGRGGAQEKERGRDSPQEEEEEKRGRGGVQEEEEERGRGGAQEKEQEGGRAQAGEGQEQEEEGRAQKTGRGGPQEVGGATTKKKEEVGPKEKVKMVRVVRMEGEENGPPVKRLRLTMIVR
ncbi:tripartite motif-containing protein 66-like [Lepisosteus oculatus]|uniref:tripartite motif-containing protein 66-like n=1 Tax=Lepisosteus oculatus TaxID=7918 RepID=UPI00371E1B79